MTIGNATETDLLNLIFNGTALPWNAVVNLDLHLHTADPGEAGTTATNETAYGSYALVQVARTAGGWTVAGNTAENVSLIQFPQCTGPGPYPDITYISIAPAGSTQIILSGALSSPIPVSAGIRPQIEPGDLQALLD